MVTTKLQLMFMVTALVYLISLVVSPYFMQFALKTLPIVVLLALAYAKLTGLLRKLMVAALLASAVGDVLLALELQNGFVMGLGAFLIAQMLYTVSFVKFRQVHNDKTLSLAGAFSVGVFAVLMALYILPNTGELLVPVVFYLLVISCMGMVAFLCGMHKFTVFGACCFLCSDAMIAQSVFKSDFAMSSVWIMLTYYCAQYFILDGMIKLQTVPSEQD